MTPPWGLELKGVGVFSIRMPPPRGSIRFKGQRPAFQEMTHRFVAHPFVLVLLLGFLLSN